MNACPVAGRRGPRAGLLILSILLLILADTGYAEAAICRVTTDGTAANSGASWGSPMALQTALDDVACTEIWMAGGFYRHQPGSPQTLSWTISRELAVYGGFAGTETSRDERDFVANVTVLSGDNDLNDINEDGNHIAETTDDIVGDNSHRILFIDGTTGISITGNTVLDGLTITAADGNVPGGGLYCDGSGGSVFNKCSPTLRNLTFSANRAGGGGAIENNGSAGGESNPMLINVMFNGNFASSGGAMYNNGSGGESSPTLIHVTFNGNSVYGAGGAMYNGAHTGVSSPQLIDVAFSGNYAAQDGGAMYNGASSGGVSNPILNNVTFKDNSTGNFGSGGAMYNDGGGSSGSSVGTASPMLANVTFSGNTTGSLGGGGGSGGTGGAMFNTGRGHGVSSPSLINVTFTGNIADTGGAIYNHSGGGVSSPTLSNVILWGNTAISGVGQEIYNNASATGTVIPTVDHSIVQGSGGSDAWDPLLGIDGGGNLDSNPALGPLGYHGGYTQTHLPAAGSVAIDAGNAATCPDVDQRYVPRPQGPTCDIGAVEFGVDYLFANGFELATPPQ